MTEKKTASKLSQTIQEIKHTITKLMPYSRLKYMYLRAIDTSKKIKKL